MIPSHWEKTQLALTLTRRKTVPSDTDYLLAIEDLTVSFDGFKAVDELTLYIDKGELRVIIGPNGAGKTHRSGSDQRKNKSLFRKHSLQ